MRAPHVRIAAWRGHARFIDEHRARHAARMGASCSMGRQHASRGVPRPPFTTPPRSPSPTIRGGGARGVALRCAAPLHAGRVSVWLPLVGVQCVAYGARRLARGVWRAARGVRRVACGVLACGGWRVLRGTWCLAADARRVALGAWRCVRGVWRVVFGAWHPARGNWRLARGDWRLAPGAWRLALGAR